MQTQEKKTDLGFIYLFTHIVAEGFEQTQSIKFASVKYWSWQASIESIKRRKAAWISSLEASNYLMLKFNYETQINCCIKTIDDSPPDLCWWIYNYVMLILVRHPHNLKGLNLNLFLSSIEGWFSFTDKAIGDYIGWKAIRLS